MRRQLSVAEYVMHRSSVRLCFVVMGMRDLARGCRYRPPYAMQGTRIMSLYGECRVLKRGPQFYMRLKRVWVRLINKRLFNVNCKTEERAGRREGLAIH